MKQAGFEEVGWHGSHLNLQHPVKRLATCVPMRAGDPGRSLVHTIIQQTDLTKEEFRKLL
jgi:predicted RNA binding protein YcfA (HicA-like mRNA interferase family)